ncbi:MAG TPA: Asp-tRNA(Asn)/Glu-tRNA(Gln) amidotransferase subunit GatA [Candidatus Paceibacterota bacterium]
MDLKNLTISKAHQALLKKEFSVLDFVNTYKKNIESKNTVIHAYLEVFSDLEQQALESQKLIDAGKGGFLTGIPIAVKDNILIKGKVASAGSKILENFISPYDATSINRLKKQGAIFLGRTNMDEFAMGSSTENSGFGVTRNPLDPTRVPGGSSGGSAAAVADEMALAALGSDTGGSVRQPASLCGIVGLKPTYGAVSRFGLIALGSSLDQIGPLTKTVTDAEIIFNAIKGKDSLDSTSYYPDPPALRLPEKLKIGIPWHLIEVDGISEDVLKNFKESVSKLEKLGFGIEEIELPNVKYSLAVYYILMPAEASSNLARFDGVKYGAHLNADNLIDDYFETRGKKFGKEVRRRIILGTYVLSSGYYDAYYNKANSLRSLIKSDFEKVFEMVHLVLTPTSPTPAFKIGEKVENPLEMYLADIFTVPANVAGLPAVSIPSGMVKVHKDELPLGIQFTASDYREDLLFEVGKKFLGESD